MALKSVTVWVFFGTEKTCLQKKPCYTVLQSAQRMLCWTKCTKIDQYTPLIYYLRPLAVHAYKIPRHTYLSHTRILVFLTPFPPPWMSPLVASLGNSLSSCTMCCLFVSPVIFVSSVQSVSSVLSALYVLSVLSLLPVLSVLSVSVVLFVFPDLFCCPAFLIYLVCLVCFVCRVCRVCLVLSIFSGLSVLSGCPLRRRTSTL
jgi:hypothetical protein